MPIQQRILLCRLGFVLFCLLPTLAVGLWIVSRPASSFGGATRDQWQAELTARTGLTVEIERVDYPEPGLARLTQIVLRDPETQALVAQAGTIEVGLLDGGWLVESTQLAIQASQLPRLRQTLEHRVLRQPASGGSDQSQPLLTLLTSDITLRSAESQQTLTRVEGTLVRSDSGVNLRLSWLLPEAVDATQAGRFTVQRNRTASPPETLWQLDTAGHPVPCGLLADLLPPILRMGRECKFAGGVQWVDSPAGSRGSLHGTFSEVDLDALVTEHFPHRLSGLGRLQIDRAAVADGKLFELRGQLHVRGGQISPSLLAAMQEHLGLECQLDHLALLSSRPVGFEQLAATFQIDGRALQLAGIADPARDGVAIATATAPLLTAPPGHTTASVNLLRALLPDNQYQVPATRQTDALVGLLPVPDLVPAHTAALPRHTPTRLRTSGPADAAPVLRPPKLR